MIEYTKPIAESKNFIVLDKYTQEWKVCENGQGYQSENDLEQEFIRDLQNRSRRPLMPLRSLAIKTPKTWYWRKAIKNTWKALLM